MPVGSYHIVEYDPSWPRLFREEKDRIVALLGIDPGRLEHVGSTAVPGLGAKPIIDMMLGVDLDPGAEESQSVLEKLNTLSYEHCGIETAPGTLYIRKANPRRYNLHMTRHGNAFWIGHLAFRDYLITHPEVTREYEELKRRLLAEMGPDPDRAAYNLGKEAFIVAVTSRAMMERSD
jgi:GrpB-like predicted nucleotidyltransferase (UPF0157 family)